MGWFCFANHHHWSDHIHIRDFQPQTSRATSWGSPKTIPIKHRTSGGIYDWMSRTSKFECEWWYFTNLDFCWIIGVPFQKATPWVTWSVSFTLCICQPLQLGCSMQCFAESPTRAKALCFTSKAWSVWWLEHRVGFEVVFLYVFILMFTRTI